MRWPGVIMHLHRIFYRLMLDLRVPLYILWYMKTILNVKTEKDLKEAAQETARELGIPLGTAVNAFLKQFVREKEITLSAQSSVPTPYLQRIIKEAQEEYERGESSGPFSARALLDHLAAL
jgi:DNA-damage-inducible protein J